MIRPVIALLSVYRTAWLGALVTLPLAGSANAQAFPPGRQTEIGTKSQAAQTSALPQPVYFEVQINGESFLVESNRVAKVKSGRNPNVNYQLAVRFAPVQPVQLNTFRFEYERPAALEDNNAPVERTVKLKHELGYTLFVADLGASLNETDVEKLLMNLTDSASDTFRKMGLDSVKVAEPHSRDFAQVKGRGNVVRYQDKEGFQHTCLVYVLAGKTFGASFIAEYLDNDADDVLPLLKRIIDSMRPSS